VNSKRPPKGPYQRALEQLKEVAEQPEASLHSKRQEKERVSTQVDEERVRRERIENDNKEKDQTLKEQTLRLLFTFLVAETVVVFVIALIQGFRILGFRLDEWSLRLLLAATIVQTVSMLTIAIKHLFPQKKQ
jgi:ribosomal protein S4